MMRELYSDHNLNHKPQRVDGDLAVSDLDFYSSIIQSVLEVHGSGWAESFEQCRVFCQVQLVPPPFSSWLFLAILADSHCLLPVDESHRQVIGKKPSIHEHISSINSMV